MGAAGTRRGRGRRTRRFEGEGRGDKRGGGERMGSVKNAADFLRRRIIAVAPGQKPPAATRPDSKFTK